MTGIIHPGVYLEKVSSGGYSIPGVTTSTTGLIGTAVIGSFSIASKDDPHRSREPESAHPGMALPEVLAWLTEQLAAGPDQVAPKAMPITYRLAKAALSVCGRPDEVAQDT